MRPNGLSTYRFDPGALRMLVDSTVRLADPRHRFCDDYCKYLNSYLTYDCTILHNLNFSRNFSRLATNTMVILTTLELQHLIIRNY